MKKLYTTLYTTLLYSHKWPFPWMKNKITLQVLLKQSLSHDPLRIVIGAGGIYQAGWIPTEQENLNLLIPQDWEACFNKNSISAILAEHVWEHLTYNEGISAAKVCRNFLTTGGYIRIAVPDGYNPDPAYINHVKPGGTGPGLMIIKFFLPINYYPICSFKLGLLSIYWNTMMKREFFISKTG